MLAKRVEELPTGDGWIFEPKWDGFRALIFRDGDEIFIQSRDQKPLNRYFPDLLDPLRATLPPRCVVDGEIVIVKNNGLDFDELQLRIHPAASRVRLLSEHNPASMVFFDLLADGENDLCPEPFEKRRAVLEGTTSERRCAYSHHAGNVRRRHCFRLVSTIRRRGSGRRDGETGWRYL